MFVLESRLRLLLLMLARWWSEAHLLVEKTLARNDEAIQAAATDSACGWNTDDVIISFHCLPCCCWFVAQYMYSTVRTKDREILPSFSMDFSISSPFNEFDVGDFCAPVGSRWKESD